MTDETEEIVIVQMTETTTEDENKIGAHRHRRVIYPKKEQPVATKKRRSHLNFREITPPENRRTYIFDDNQRIIIEGVARVAIADSGNHRIETTTGERFIIRTGWKSIKIETLPGAEWSF